jgi:hypothetical protein
MKPHILIIEDDRISLKASAGLEREGAFTAEVAPLASRSVGGGSACTPPDRGWAIMVQCGDPDLNLPGWRL